MNSLTSSINVLSAPFFPSEEIDKNSSLLFSSIYVSVLKHICAILRLPSNHISIGSFSVIIEETNLIDSSAKSENLKASFPVILAFSSNCSATSLIISKLSCQSSSSIRSDCIFSPFSSISQLLL